MPPQMTDPQDARRLVGDYRLVEKLAENADSATWLAEQVSIGRMVILEELCDATADARERFLADTRAQAAVDHPFVASVYEAVDNAGHCFRSSERLPGESLQALADAGIALEPARLVRMLRRIAKANLNHETNQRSTLPLTLGDVFVNEHDVTRIRNLAVTGGRAENESPRDVTRLGAKLGPLMADGRPGTTRMLTLLAWMQGKEVPAPLKWQEVLELCDQIDQQLSGPVDSESASSIASVNRRQINRTLIKFGAVTAVALAVIVALAFAMRPPKPTTAPVSKPLPAPVLVPAGEHLVHDGSLLHFPGFLIDAHETTIGEYREFLEILAVLEIDGRHLSFDHPEQPAEKPCHTPDDWEALLAAAVSRGRWNDAMITLDSPVPGVDWWDATAYANWRKARLPTQEEWAAALHFQGGDPRAIPVGTWQPVTKSDTPDITPAGLLGMAGSLAEWTREPGINPANPLGRPSHIIVGSSHIATSGDALSREWTDDRSLRRRDLGFRLVRDVPAP